MFLELAIWDNYRYAALRAGQFLKIVEPNIEGLSRIVAACELAQEAYDGDNGIVRLVGSWARSLGQQLRLGLPPRPGDHQRLLDRDAEDQLFGLGLERWTDPNLAASFVRDVFECDGYFDEDGPYEALREDYNEWEFMEPSYRQMHERWARDWRDRDRAAAFVPESRRPYAAVSCLGEEHGFHPAGTNRSRPVKRRKLRGL